MTDPVDDTVRRRLVACQREPPKALEGDASSASNVSNITSDCNSVTDSVENTVRR